MSVFSALALFIAALGIYGVMAYSSASARVRSASAWRSAPARADVQRLVMGQATRLTLHGRRHRPRRGLRPHALHGQPAVRRAADDPPTFVVVTVILAASAVFAAWLPVARAVRVDPVVALRHE
jgi:putative ABC transport system permease protein